MRTDMQRVIVERPRWKPCNKYSRNKIGLHELDEFGDLINDRPTRISHLRDNQLYRAKDLKEQTDLLGPLHRYLQKQVGRPWNEVWSDICANTAGLMGDHVKEHVESYVNINTYIDEDGVIRNWYGNSVEESWRWDSLYVHPETKILCRAKKKTYNPSTGRKTNIISMGGNEYFNHNGIWYRVKTKPISEVRFRYGIDEWDYYSAWRKKDAFGVHYSASETYSFYKISVWCIWKQAANKKEIKLLNKIT